jgi:hypothetical protein
MTGIALIFGLSLSFPIAAPAQAETASPACRPDSQLIRLTDLREGSGVALGQRGLWTHNDSGRPVLYGLDGNGAVTRRVEVTGARIDDWEAIAAGPCPAGTCLYLADIGDNNARRSHVTIYRVEEPAAGSSTVAVEAAIQAAYPDGAHDAEALFVGPGDRLYIVTKGETGPVVLYRFPIALQAGRIHKLERVGALVAERPPRSERITDAATSPDRRTLVLRTESSFSFYAVEEFIQGRFRPLRRIDLTALAEPQGEGIAIGPGGVVYLVGESGAPNRPGTFARLAC